MWCEDAAMTPENFRRIALTMPETAESAHMGHPDFRVSGKIFATLFSRDELVWGMVKLTPAQQRQFIETNPAVFEPIPGGWGRRGATQVRLKVAKKADLRNALFTAWCNTAPKRLVEQQDRDSEP